MSAQHTPGPAQEAITRADAALADAHLLSYSALLKQHAALLDVAERLALAADEGDDQAQGTHYVDKHGAIRCKGSFLETIERARRAIGSTS